jgi:Siphovirus Gp157
METVVMTQDPVLPFAEPTQRPAAASDTFASDHSLLDIDREIDVMLDLMQDELEETGEISEESRNRFERFCEAFGQKVDRIGRFIRVMEAREAFCKSEAARLAARGKTAENKAAQTKALVLYFLETRSLTKVEDPQFTLRRQKNSQDSLKIKNPDAIPMRLRRVTAKFDGELWEKIRAALPTDLQRPFDAGLEDSSPCNDGIKREIAAGAEFEGVSVARAYHVRVA